VSVTCTRSLLDNLHLKKCVHLTGDVLGCQVIWVSLLAVLAQMLRSGALLSVIQAESECLLSLIARPSLDTNDSERSSAPSVTQHNQVSGPGVLLSRLF
jgi:hypothetical protein